MDVSLQRDRRSRAVKSRAMDKYRSYYNEITQGRMDGLFRCYKSNPDMDISQSIRELVDSVTYKIGKEKNHSNFIFHKSKPIDKAPELDVPPTRRADDRSVVYATLDADFESALRSLHSTPEHYEDHNDNDDNNITNANAECDSSSCESYSSDLSECTASIEEVEFISGDCTSESEIEEDLASNDSFMVVEVDQDPDHPSMSPGTRAELMSCIPTLGFEVSSSQVIGQSHLTNTLTDDDTDTDCRPLMRFQNGSRDVMSDEHSTPSCYHALDSEERQSSILSSDCLISWFYQECTGSRVTDHAS